MAAPALGGAELGRIPTERSPGAILGAVGGAALTALVADSWLGSLGGEQQTADMAPFFPNSPSAYWQYSTKGISANALAGQFAKEMPGVKRVHLNGHSMGGPMGFDVLRRAEPIMPGLTLGDVYLHGSPFDITDARQGRIASFAGRLPGVQMGPATKMTFSAIRNLLERKTLLETVVGAYKDGLSGCSTQLWCSQIKALMATDLRGTERQLHRIVDGATSITYCMPEEPANDPTVNTEQSCDKYAGLAKRLGVPFAVLRLPNAGHADVTAAVAAIAAARSWVSEALDRAA